jgi:hypothetical protein
MDAAATKEDLAYVLDGFPQPTDDAWKWDYTAKRMVNVCALWRMKKHVTPKGHVDSLSWSKTILL